MLTELLIKNYALIDEARINFSPGLNIISGETGTGKSIIIGALNLVLGERAHLEQIRHGTDYAQITAEFTVSKKSQHYRILQDLDISMEDQKLILQRRLNISGKSSCRINGIPVALNQLKEVGDLLLDICGQHDHISLLNIAGHLSILDAISGNQKEFKDYNTVFKEHSEICKNLEQLVQKQNELNQKKDFLIFQLNELNNANLKVGEEDSLRKTLLQLEHREKLFDLCLTALNFISEQENSALSTLGTSQRLLTQAANLDSGLKQALEFVDQGKFNLAEASGHLKSYINSLAGPEEDLDKINSRLMEIIRIKNKYRMDIKDILNYRLEIEKEVNSAENFSAICANLKTKNKEVLKKLSESSDTLTRCRKASANSFDKKMNNLLHDLGMEGAFFKTGFNASEEFLASGKDIVEFLIQSNPGEIFKPISRIASGGEISRVMLGIKSILSDNDHIPTLIFDEVDSGIGGKAANRVGRVLKQLSGSHQVICITHLHQIASLADSHFAVCKEGKNQRIATRIRLIKEQERIIELARMLGDDGNEQTLAHAEDLVKRSRVNS
ncbi:MAG: DNA repair protein RecN [bacterium]